MSDQPARHERRAHRGVRRAAQAAVGEHGVDGLAARLQVGARAPRVAILGVFAARLAGVLQLRARRDARGPQPRGQQAVRRELRAEGGLGQN